MVLPRKGKVDPKTLLTFQDQIKTRNENYLKLRLVKEYFADPQAVNDPQMFDFDFMMYSSKQTSSTVNAQKVLFCVTIENPAKEIKVLVYSEGCFNP